VRRYQTQVVIPTDRVIIVHLPDDMPAGPALVSVDVGEPRSLELQAPAFPEAERQDIEWWEAAGVPGDLYSDRMD
jgi:hypothetical protein